MTQLRSFVERIERLEEEISAFNADKSEVYKEAKSTGFDVKVLRKVIAARRMDRSERQEADALFDLYMAELEGSVRAHVEIIGQISSEFSSPSTIRAGTVPPPAVPAPIHLTPGSPSRGAVAPFSAGVEPSPGNQPIHDDIPAFLRDAK